MIEVKAYYNIPKNTKKGCDIKFTEIIVKGHANNGDMNSIKCCAGVTSILYGFSKVCTGGDDEVMKMEKGYFYYKTYHNVVELDYYSNLVIIQLYEVYKTYPSLFSKFDLIEKENY